MVAVEDPHDGGPSYASDPVDAIIVGAGPAGSMAALLLARRGLDVLLLDRAAFPRPKPCGDCLSAAATDLLRRHGLLDDVIAAGATPITRWDIVAPDGTRASGRFDDATAYSLERRDLDPVLLARAVDAGARFRQAHVTGLLAGDDDRVTGVRIRGSDGAHGPLRARLVIGADGLRSVVARELDLIRRRPRLRKVSLTTHLPADTRDAGHGEMHVLTDGCIGWAPAGTGRCNLTLVVGRARAAELRDLGPPALLRRCVREAPALGSRVAPEALDDDLEILGSGPFDWPTRAPVARGAALIGDAAGYYDPFTGQGMYHAMASAERLDQAIGPTLAHGATGHGASVALDRALDHYARAKTRLTRPTRVVQRGVEWVLSRPGRANLAIGRLRAARPAMDRLIEVTGDLRPASSLLSARVLSSLLVPPAPESP